MSDTVHGIWVVGQYEGERAKSVLAHAHAGLGYLVLEQGGGKYNPFCLAASIYTGAMPLPPYLEEVRDPTKIQRYDDMRKSRSGARVK
jgi:hypothetical protein